MKLLYAIALIIIVKSVYAQGIEMEYVDNSPILSLSAKYDSVEHKGSNFFEGGDANIILQRTDEDYEASLIFDLTNVSHLDSDIQVVDDTRFIQESWNIGVDGDDQFRIYHHDRSIMSLGDSYHQDILVFDASEDGSHEDPIVKVPQGRIFLGDDIKLYATTDNSLTIAGGDVVPSGAISQLGIINYDLGKDQLASHWDDVVANNFVTYSFLPDIVFVKSNTSSLDILDAIQTYQSNDNNKVNSSSRMMLNPKELKGVFPEALHLYDEVHLPDGTTKTVTIDNPGIIYDRFIPLLIDGMQEQKELIDQQAAYIQSIEARLLKLEGK